MRVRGHIHRRHTHLVHVYIFNSQSIPVHGGNRKQLTGDGTVRSTGLRTMTRMGFYNATPRDWFRP